MSSIKKYLNNCYSAKNVSNLGSLIYFPREISCFYDSSLITARQMRDHKWTIFMIDYDINPNGQFVFPDGILVAPSSTYHYLTMRIIDNEPYKENISTHAGLTSYNIGTSSYFAHSISCIVEGRRCVATAAYQDNSTQDIVMIIGQFEDGVNKILYGPSGGYVYGTEVRYSITQQTVVYKSISQNDSTQITYKKLSYVDGWVDATETEFNNCEVTEDSVIIRKNGGISVLNGENYFTWGYYDPNTGEVLYFVPYYNTLIKEIGNSVLNCGNIFIFSNNSGTINFKLF